MKKLLLLLLMLAVLIYWWRVPRTVQGPSSEHEFEYILRVSGSGGPSDTLPMVIALHGHGDTPDNFFDTMFKDFDRPARFIVVRGPMDYAGGISLSGSAWPIDTGGLREYGDSLADAVSVLIERFPTEGRPVVVGFSGGAYFAYYLAAFHADLFSYIFPLSGGLHGGLMRSGAVSYENGARVIAFHGRADQVIGYNLGKSAVQVLRQRGVTADLVTFDGGHIDIFMSANRTFLNRLGDALDEL
jgi:predicted esterase